MKVKTMRILTLLLAMVLMFGLFPGVAQASAYEDPDLPAPIEGYDPLDPDNPYPYGLPVGVLESATVSSPLGQEPLSQ